MHTRRVIKNSFWLIVQPLFLNFLSIFATAYIARKLGVDYYGKFTFAIAFVAMFAPIVNLGLRPLTIRELAEKRDNQRNFIGKMLTLRFLLSLVAVSIIFAAMNLMRYPPLIRYIVYIASLTLIFQAITSTLNDVFQAREEMKYVAWVQFVSGFTLTILSIIVLFIGFKLIGLMSVNVS